jgi:glycosyltransferase involved in cell wall biosynthesis
VSARSTNSCRPAETPGTVAVVFSKDRPLQLDGTLRSLRAHALDLDQVLVKVLWTASGWRQSALYERLAEKHPDTEFVEERAFKSQLIASVQEFSSVMFLVDDTIFVRPFSIAVAASALDEDSLAIGYSLRLGRNIDYCYSLNKPASQPAWEPRTDGSLAYRWAGADGDFGYPLELSSSIYRAADVCPLLSRLDYRNPNTLEAALSREATRLADSLPVLICPDVSVAFSTPVNVVQQVFPNRAGLAAPQTSEQLAEAFRAGMRLDVQELAGYPANAPHQEIQLPLKKLGSRIPLVSVVIPCFRQAEYLPRAMDSVLRQTTADWELVVVDDGSPDDTAQVFERYRDLHPEVALFLVRQPNAGLAAARNAGIAASHGIYVLPLDADDEIEERMLERASAVLDSDRSIAFVYTDAIHASHDSELIVPAEDFDPGRECDRNQPNYAALFPRSVWKTIGGYNPNMLWGYEDWDFWLSCVDHSLIGRRLPEPLFRYRVRPNSMFSNATAHDRELREILRRNHPALFTPRRRATRFMRRSAGRLSWLLRQGLRRNAGRGDPRN